MGTPTPGSSTPKSDGNMLLDCVVCGRQVRFLSSLDYVAVCLIARGCLCVSGLLVGRVGEVCTTFEWMYGYEWDAEGIVEECDFETEVRVFVYISDFCVCVCLRWAMF